METGKLAALPTFNLFMEEKNIDLHGVCPIFLEHLTTFVSKLNRYIPCQSYSQMFNWVRTPFEVSALEVHSQINCIAEQLIKLLRRQMWRDKFKIVSLLNFGRMFSQWNQIFLISASKQQLPFSLFQQHSRVKPAFQHWLWLKPSTARNCNRKMISDCIDNHSS